MSTTNCCPKCIGAYKDSDLDRGVCRNTACECHTATTKGSWEEEFEKRMVIKDVFEGERDDSLNPIVSPEDIKSFIRETLASERTLLREKIEDLSFRSKEPNENPQIYHERAIQHEIFKGEILALLDSDTN